MKLHAATIVSALGLLGSPLAQQSLAQQPLAPAEAARESPRQLFERAQSQVAQGVFDAAGETLKRFRAARPTPADYRAITDREPTAFQKLRFNVPVWSENAAANTEYKQVVAEITAASEAAIKELSRDPARIARFVNNLAETDEERIFAEQQLRLAGDAVVPALIDAIRTANDPGRQAKIVAAVGKLNAEQLPGILASSLDLDLPVRLAVLQAAANRPDARTLSNAPDTDLLPHLWYYAASRGIELNALRTFSALTLDEWTAGQSQRTNGPTELVRLAAPLTRNQGRYRGEEPVKLWQFDPTKSAPVARAATLRQANDYHALRNVRWALERNPGNPDAIELFLATAVERAVENAQFGNVLEADPALLPILAGADSAMLNALLTRALGEQKTALALGLTQILAARLDKPAAAGPFLVALDYPDARVQLAAAVGLLKVPGAAPGLKAARIVDILGRAAAVEAATPGKVELGRALIADPSDARGAKLASYLTNLGYRAERFGTGRQLAGRLRGASDADLIFVDRHIGDPTVTDLLATLRTNRDTALRPLFVIASDDFARPLSLDRLLVRLAVLVAVADTSPLTPPETFRFDEIRRLRPEEIEQARAKIVLERDQVLTRLYEGRLAQLQRLTAGAGFPPSQTLRTYLDLRMPQLTLAVLAAKYPLSAQSAPANHRLLAERTRTLALNSQLQYSTAGLDTTKLTRVVEDLDATLDPTRRAEFEALLTRIDADALLIPRDKPAEPALMDRLARAARNPGRVTVIPEPTSVLALREDIAAAVTDPSLLPVPAAVRRQNARLAVEYLRRMAVGEITGFDIRPAEAALRSALRDDELAVVAADAVARLGSPQAQQDLIGVALSPGRPLPVRLLAADRAIQSVETFGPLVPAPQRLGIEQAASVEADRALRGRLAVLAQLVAPQPANISELIQNFPLPLPVELKKPEPAPNPKEPKADPLKN